MVKLTTDILYDILNLNKRESFSRKQSTRRVSEGRCGSKDVFK